jgi:hypothetical protein
MICNALCQIEIKLCLNKSLNETDAFLLVVEYFSVASEYFSVYLNIPLLYLNISVVGG